MTAELSLFQQIKLPLIGIVEQSANTLKLLQSDNINEQIDGQTAFLYCAGIYGRKTGKRDIIKNVMIKLIHFPGHELIIDNKSLLDILINETTFINNDIITILLKRGLSPDIPNKKHGNVIKPLLIRGKYDTVKLLLEYGADPMFGCYSLGLYSSPLYFAFRSCLRDTQKMICKNIKVYTYINTIHAHGLSNDDIRIIYDDILLYGKIENIHYLGDEDKKILDDFTQWIDTLLCIKNTLTMKQLRDISRLPLHNMVCAYNNPLGSLRKMLLFKYNLESLIGMQINRPMFIYYDTVVLFVFLIKFPELISLSSDTMKMILYHMFR